MCFPDGLGTVTSNCYKWSTKIKNQTTLTTYANPVLRTGKSLFPSSRKANGELITTCKLLLFVEIAYHCWHLGYKFQDVPNEPAAYATSLRKCIDQCLKQFPDSPIVPGTVVASNKSNGRTLPSGLVQGAELYIPSESLKAIAIAVISHGQHLSNWKRHVF